MHCGHAHLNNHEPAFPEHHLWQSSPSPGESCSIRPAMVLANVIAMPHDSISVRAGGCKGGDGGAGDGGGGGVGDGWKGVGTAGDGVTKTVVEFAVCDSPLLNTNISRSSLPGPAAGTAPRLGIRRGRFNEGHESERHERIGSGFTQNPTNPVLLIMDRRSDK